MLTDVWPEELFNKYILHFLYIFFTFPLHFLPPPLIYSQHVEITYPPCSCLSVTSAQWNRARRTHNHLQSNLQAQNFVLCESSNHIFFLFFKILLTLVFCLHVCLWECQTPRNWNYRHVGTGIWTSVCWKMSQSRQDRAVPILNCWATYFPPCSFLNSSMEP